MLRFFVGGPRINNLKFTFYLYFFVLLCPPPHSDGGYAGGDTPITQKA